ncbi:uncharacterized protein JCM15063_002302 [Sporobolomyces koalae]|uniref:uncharacterized protein n=1 Tax=Sporobolomyces koalae TaxID=500713 RepID=UPI00317E5852
MCGQPVTRLYTGCKEIPVFQYAISLGLVVVTRIYFAHPRLLRNLTDATSGLSSQTGAIGQGSVGGNTDGKGVESKAGGREMNDSNSSMKGDTSSEPNVNNEAPSSGSEGADIKTDSESSKFSADGSSGATTSEL